MVRLLEQGVETAAGLFNSLDQGLDLLFRGRELGAQTQVFVSERFQNRVHGLQFVVKGVEFSQHLGMVSIPQAIIES
jgi:hypothetical protein